MLYIFVNMQLIFDMQHAYDYWFWHATNWFWHAVCKYVYAAMQAYFG